jgi:molybdopterin-guanine dinucleotide biosynthesis protein MobB
MTGVVSVIGFHGSGKTKVVEAIVRELTKNGYRVGTVKHITDPDFTIDEPGKDTWVHARAGAKVVVSVAPNEVARIEKRSAGLREVLRTLNGLDFVIVEGFKSAKGLARIVVARNRAEADELVDRFTIACVGAGCSTVPTFSFRRAKEIASIIENKFSSR